MEILKAVYDNRASFNGKAEVEEYSVCLQGAKVEVKKLFSYKTLVAEIIDGKAFVLGQWSMTTSRHIKEFLKQNGFNAKNTKQILKDYGKK